jgi:hypothetical protein
MKAVLTITITLDDLHIVHLEAEGKGTMAMQRDVMLKMLEGGKRIVRDAADGQMVVPVSDVDLPPM